MFNMFDDDMSAEELAFALGIAEQMADEQRRKFDDNEPVLPTDDESQWWED